MSNGKMIMSEFSSNIIHCLD